MKITETHTWTLEERKVITSDHWAGLRYVIGPELIKTVEFSCHKGTFDLNPKLLDFIAGEWPNFKREIDRRSYENGA